MADDDNKSPRDGAANSPEDTSPRQGGIRVKSSRAEKAREVRRKWRMVAAALIVGGLVLGYFASGGRTHLKVAVNHPPVSLTPPGVSKQSFESRTQTRLHELGQRITSLRAQQDNLSHEIDALRKGQQKYEVTNSKNFNQINQDLLKLQARLSSIAANGLPRHLPPPQPGPSTLPPPPPPPPGSPTAPSRHKQQAGPQPQAGVQPQPATGPGQSPVVLTPPASSEGKKVGVHVHYVQNPYAGYIPGGSFAPAVLLTGIEAGTATSAQSNPQPVLMRIQRDAVLPDDARYEVSRCFAIGSAYGSLSSQRAYIRLATLSCVAKGRGMLLEAPLKGYAVDSDGMFGLRGKLVERRGALLAKTLLAGFASGLGNALAAAQGTAYSGLGGYGTTISGTSVLKAGAFSGASTAANQLAQFYLKEAESIFPVIEVPPKRKITLVVTSGTSLKWHRYRSLYVPRVKPVK